MTVIEVLNLLLILAILSVFFLVIFFRITIQYFIEKLYKKIRSVSPFQKQPVSLEKTISHFKFVFNVISIQLFLFSSFLVYILKESNLMGVYLNSMNFSNLTEFLKNDVVYNLTCGNQTCHIIGGTNFSFENLSILIALLTGLIIYTHFFGMISEDPYISMKSETRKKYFWFFENLVWITLVYAFFIFFGLIFGVITNFLIQIILLAYAWINIVMLVPISENFKKLFENYENIEKFNQIAKDNPNLPWYKNSGILNKGDVISIYLFILTLEFAYFGFLLNINIFLLIFIESSFILMHIWVSRINHIPKDKHTLELISGPPLEDVFVIDDITDEYYVIISKEAGVSKIMKTFVKRIYVKDDAEGNTDNA